MLNAYDDLIRYKTGLLFYIIYYECVPDRGFLLVGWALLRGSLQENIFLKRRLLFDLLYWSCDFKHNESAISKMQILFLDVIYLQIESRTLL